jgi:hypothetical protein
MTRRLVIALSAITLITALPAAAAQAAARSSGHGAGHRGLWAEHAALVRYQRLHGYLPAISPASYARLKARITAAASAHPAASARPAGAGAAQPGIAGLAAAASVGASSKGLRDTSVAPSDSTGAIGPNSYIEMINLKIGIYNRSLGLVASANLGALTGQPNGNLSDPQVIWDPATNRFYYVILNVASDNLQWGFSKSANPTSIPGGFCNYTADFGYGADLPDYPKLGDTRHDLLIGVDVFAPFEVVPLPDVAWITKPAGTGTISSCPSAGTFKKGDVAGQTTANGGGVFTPDPGVQTDPSATSWIVATPYKIYSGPVSQIALYKVTEKSDGTPFIPLTGTPVAVSSYSIPPNAPQLGSIFPLDTLDGRTMHAVTAADPSRGGTALWTAIAVAGGAGAVVRWYEIDVANAGLFQSGAVTSSSVYTFNPAISPDRAVTSSGSAAFGSDMVLGFTASSSAVFPADEMVAKVGGNPQSGFVLVHSSPGNDIGFDCLQLEYCRWGDYSGATPDPAASHSGSTGRVWLTQMYATGGGPLDTTSEWGTWNWEAAP